MKLQATGTPRDELLAEMREIGARDADWRGGKTWSLVYYAGDELTSLLKDAYAMYFSENALSPMAFPSLRRFESDVVAATAGLLGGGDEAAGSMTSGGSESIMMAVKTARDRARAERGVTSPEMVLPVTVHPAFEKAAHYFSVKPLHIPLTAHYRADVDAMRAAISDNTVLAVGSAPCYPYGVIDPIPEMATLAAERGVAFHVDACLGGFMLPFLRRLGYAIPPFDFSVPGVTSMSADVHKYGYAAKGASVVLYRNKEVRRHQFFSYADWPGGLYGSPTMTGTRPGGAIAAAWAALRFIGEDGYLRLARTAMDATKLLIDGINAVPELLVRGEPAMSVFAFGSDSLDIYAVGDALETCGWRADRLQLPPNLHLMVTAAHEHVVPAFLADLAEATRNVAESGASSSSTAAYSQTD